MADNTTRAYDGSDIYTHDIYKYLDQYMDEKGIDDLSKITQSRWNSVLLYIYDHVYKGTKRLKVKDNINNAYDLDKLNEVYDIYIRICYEYEKEVSQKGFCKLTGVTEETLTAWDRGDDKLGSSGSELHKKIKAENEESVVQLMESGKRNPMCFMPVLNRRHGWNMPGTTNGTTEKAKSVAQIAQEYGLEKPPELPQNDAQLQPPDADF